MPTRPISPMLATLGRPPARFADFAAEAKDDGQRGLAVVHGDAVTLLSRNGADITGPSRRSRRRCPRQSPSEA
jgi:bifunctional non-homologous end joining protein LigD